MTLSSYEDAETFSIVDMDDPSGLYDGNLLPQQLRSWRKRSRSGGRPGIQRSTRVLLNCLQCGDNQQIARSKNLLHDGLQ